MSYSLSRSPVVPPSLSACECGTTQYSRYHLAVSLLHPSCPSSTPSNSLDECFSLTTWLLDTVQFSGSFGYFLFLNLFSFFWLCEEAKCIYLCFHLYNATFTYEGIKTSSLICKYLENTLTLSGEMKKQSKQYHYMTDSNYSK